jgi:hypothetical protein
MGPQKEKSANTPYLVFKIYPNAIFWQGRPFHQIFSIVIAFQPQMLHGIMQRLYILLFTRKQGVKRTERFFILSHILRQG